MAYQLRHTKRCRDGLFIESVNNNSSCMARICTTFILRLVFLSSWKMKPTLLDQPVVIKYKRPDFSNDIYKRVNTTIEKKDSD